MALVEEASEDQWTPAVRRWFEDARREGRTPPNAWGALANSPHPFEGFMAYVKAVTQASSLDAHLTHMVATRIAYLVGCRYTAGHRVAAALEAGVLESDLQRTRQAPIGEWGVESVESIALLVTDAMTRTSTEIPYRERSDGLERETREALGSRFSDGEIIDLLQTIAVWNAIARMYRVLDLPLERSFPDPELDLTEPIAGYESTA